MIVKTRENTNKTIFSPVIETFTPFAGHTDNSRLNMANKQQGQIVISKFTETPIIIDPFYTKLTEIDSPFTMVAKEDGIVIQRIEEVLIIYYNESGSLYYYHVPKYKKLINNSLSLKYIVSDHQRFFKKGDTLFDYSNLIPNMNLPKIGYRANILFSSFFGYNADDAMVISESFAKKAQVEYNEKIFVPITKLMKFIKRKENNYKTFLPEIGEILQTENLFAYNQIDLNDSFLSEVINLDDKSESKYYTRYFKGIEGGKIEGLKVHKVSEKSFEELKDDYLYTKELVEELEIYYKHQQKLKETLIKTFEALGLSKELVEQYSNDIYHQYFEAINFDKKVLNDLRDKYNVDPNDIDFVLEIDISKVENTTRGDKFTNLFAGKGTVSLIIPDQLMPKDPVTGKPFDMIFNPLGIFGRNNWSMIFELGISKIIQDIEIKAKDNKSQEVKERIQFIVDNFISKYDNEYANDIYKILESEELLNNLIEDIKLNGLFFYVPNFENITYEDYYKNFLKAYEIKFGSNITEKEKIKLPTGLISYVRHCLGLDNTVMPKNEIESLYDTEIEAFYGINYILKLYHTSTSKYNSISLANSYSKTTGQPVRGRKLSGGQHLSWQSSGALLSHKENNAVLKELYTFKSDSREDKENFIMKMIKDGKYILKPKYNSNTKKTINSALRMIGMEFE